MRRKFNIKLKSFLLNNAKDKTVKELLLIVNKKFNENYGENELRKYLVRNKIPYKYENKNKSNCMGVNIPIGTEYTKSDGMVLVKVSKNEWKYKQRLIYEKYHNVKLNENDYIIFLNQDRTDFSIDNLMKVSRKESAYLSNMDVLSTNPNITKLAINLVKMQIETNNKNKLLANK